MPAQTATASQLEIADLPPELRFGQKKAIPALIDHFYANDRGILWMCCGSGKTVVCAIYIEMAHEPITVVFTPYIHLVKQWRRDYLKWLPDTKAKFMLVCSEKDSAQETDLLAQGNLLNAASRTSAEEFAELVAEVKASHGQSQISTDPEEVAAFLQGEGRKVVFCTYASSPVYGEAQRIAGRHANFGVFDEAQWTATGNKITESTYALHDENAKIDKRLFTTATVRHYSRSGLVYSMDNKAVYGGHVLVDEQGNPDPWTLRQAIEHNEAPPYRIVISFVTDPTFDPKLVQQPPYSALVADLGGKAEPDEVLRRIGQAMAMERLKEKYGVKKPLGFFNSVAMSRLYTDILNVAKNRPEYFPHLSSSEPAVSISTYEPQKERERRVEHLHNSPETEVNNARLFLFGTDENTIDAVFFGDSMTSNDNIIQASGRALRYVPDKVATIAIPAMLPYYGNDVEAYAKTITRRHVHDAYRYMIDILDGLAEMDPVLRGQIISGHSGGDEGPKLIEFDFPEGLLPVIQQAITTEVWREINPETDFVENLQRDREALEQYRLQKFPTQNNPAEEERMITLRSQIKIIPRKDDKENRFSTSARRMFTLRRDIRLYFQAEEKERRYGSHVITADRAQQVLEIYGWDKEYVLQDNFIKKMQQSAAELMRYRIQQIPKQEDPAKEAISENLRSRVMSLPTTWGSFGRFMSDVRRSLKKYYEAGKEGRYGQFVITVERVQQTLAIYGWDRSFVLQDDFEEALRQDMSALTAYRLQRFPIRNDPIEEAQAAERRDKTKLLPSRSDYAASARRMSSLCQCLGKYFEVGEKNATYGSYFITADRVEQIFQIYGWDKSFVLQSRKPSVSRNDFEENLKQDAAALAAYRLQKFPIKDDPLEELEAARARLEIRLLPHRQRGFERVADRMNTLRRCLRLYFESEENDGYYDHYVITAIRVQQIFAIYGWNRDFILQDDFEETLKQDVVALNAYRMQRIPTKGNALEELQAARSRSEIKIIPAHSQGYVATARRMRSLWKGIKAYYEAGEREGKYEGYTVTANRVQQVFQLYGWNKEFVCSDIRHRSGGGGKSRKNHYHTLPEPSDFWGPPACTRFNRIPDAFPKPII